MAGQNVIQTIACIVMILMSVTLLIAARMVAKGTKVFFPKHGYWIGMVSPRNLNTISDIACDLFHTRSLIWSGKMDLDYAMLSNGTVGCIVADEKMVVEFSDSMIECEPGQILLFSIDSLHCPVRCVPEIKVDVFRTTFNSKRDIRIPFEKTLKSHAMTALKPRQCKEDK